jgi:hypothetical protein
MVRSVEAIEVDFLDLVFRSGLLIKSVTRHGRASLTPPVYNHDLLSFVHFLGVLFPFPDSFFPFMTVYKRGVGGHLLRWKHLQERSVTLDLHLDWTGAYINIGDPTRHVFTSLAAAMGYFSLLRQSHTLHYDGHTYPQE